jgi:shikimate dehydrogenase
VDVLDESARTWGAVNTIRFEAKDEQGSWRALNSFSGAPPDELRSVGFNTDADAITQSLREDLGVQLLKSKVLLLGAGGAGRVAALKLAAEGVAELFLVNRTLKKAEALVVEIKQRFPNTQAIVGYPGGPVDLAINATSAGLKPHDPLPYDEKTFPLNRAKAVYEMIYRPAETALLSRAKAAGCRVANGLGMLLYQGAKALEIWSGQPAPISFMRAALEINIYG